MSNLIPLTDKRVGVDTIHRHNVLERGTGSRPMVFAHGFGCDQNMWRFVAPAFEDDYRVILFDHVGAGGSDLSAYDPAKVRNARRICRRCRRTLPRPERRGGVFVGHSVSAMIGVLASKKAPELFDELVLIGPSPRYVDEGEYVGGFSEDQIDELLGVPRQQSHGLVAGHGARHHGQPRSPGTRRGADQQLLPHGPRDREAFRANDLPGRQPRRSRRRAARCLVLQCAEDVIAPQAVGEYVHRHLPNSELVLMKATGHCPNLSAPEETVAAMRAFLGKKRMAA